MYAYYNLTVCVYEYYMLMVDTQSQCMAYMYDRVTMEYIGVSSPEKCVCIAQEDEYMEQMYDKVTMWHKSELTCIAAQTTKHNI